MHMRTAIIASLAMMAVAACAQAMTPAADNHYVCTPDGFALSAVPDGLHLTGTLDTPTPGYAARYVPEVQGISLISPQGMAPQVISTLEIDMILPADIAATDGSVEIELEKSFAWGIPAITCKKADSVTPESTHTP